MSTTWCLTFFLVICLYHRAQGVSITKKGCDDESIPSASHIKFTSSSTCRCQRNFSWGRSETYVLLPSPLDIHTTTQRKHAEAISTIFSTWHPSSPCTMFLGASSPHHTDIQQGHTHTCSSYGLSDPSTSENEGMLHPWNSGAELELFVGVSWHRRFSSKLVENTVPHYSSMHGADTSGSCNWLRTW